MPCLTRQHQRLHNSKNRYPVFLWSENRKQFHVNCSVSLFRALLSACVTHAEKKPWNMHARENEWIQCSRRWIRSDRDEDDFAEWSVQLPSVHTRAVNTKPEAHGRCCKCSNLGIMTEWMSVQIMSIVDGNHQLYLWKISVWLQRSQKRQQVQVC